MLKTKEKPRPPHIIEQLKKREKLIHLYYLTGRPIFNQKYDKYHIFAEKNNTMTGSYF
tara:strand:- start:916 stop:1089 length:174 start_codon:yes stop_codon:yes gene_type:complete